jgi:2-succinyl-6-hydroxy-2,4-cyclohexadiene-1-carboxylate synthase
MTRARCRVIALHGFLGSASDWAPFGQALPGARWEPIDLWDVFSDRRVSDWPTIGAALSDRITALVTGEPLPTFLVGYSMGARLALSIPDLGSASSPVAGACLVSCHPGLPEDDADGRAARKASDEAWARRLIESPVGAFWKAWDAQPVFAGSTVPHREPRLPAPRVTLARAMRLASLGGQPDRRPLLQAWQKPLLWVTGERDARFRSLAASLASSSAHATFVTCEHAGHRVPWDNPPAFARLLQEWIGEDGPIAYVANHQDLRRHPVRED